MFIFTVDSYEVLIYDFPFHFLGAFGLWSFTYVTYLNILLTIVSDSLLAGMLRMWLKLLKNVWVAKTQMYNYMLLWWALLLSFIYLVLWNYHFPYIFRVSIWHCSCIFLFLPWNSQDLVMKWLCNFSLFLAFFFWGSTAYYQITDLLFNNAVVRDVDEQYWRPYS